jgi:transposase InsO family protein
MPAGWTGRGAQASAGADHGADPGRAGRAGPGRAGLQPPMGLTKRGRRTAPRSRPWRGSCTCRPCTLFSRRIVGWAIERHMRKELVLDALEMTIQRRKPTAGVTQHSDHGSQYTALLFSERCEQGGIEISMASIGDCFDNAMCEAFHASLKRELINRRPWPTRAEARSGLRVHRGLVRPQPTPLHARLSVARAVRANAPRPGRGRCTRLSVAGERSSASARRPLKKSLSGRVPVVGVKAGRRLVRQPFGGLVPTSGGPGGVWGPPGPGSMRSGW